MKLVIMRLFKRENAFVILLVIGGLLGLIGVPQKIGITSDQILLALLAVLAVDTLIERLGYLHRIEAHLADIENKINLRTCVDDIFRSFDELPPFELLLKQCEEIWVSGKNLHGFLTTYKGPIQDATENGKRFRFLIVDPDNPELMRVLAASSFMYPKKEQIEKIGKDAIDILKGMAQNASKKNAIEVKLASYLPTNSYLIAVGRKEYGEMIVQMYGYKIPRSMRRHIHLTREVDIATFGFHLKQFESMWKDAKPLSNESH